MDYNLSSKRGDGESFAKYKERRKKNNIRIKEHLKGELIWDSRNRGTYGKKV